MRKSGFSRSLLWLAAVSLWLSFAPARADTFRGGKSRPRVLWIALGGTIAGLSENSHYAPAKLGIRDLTGAIPELDHLARVQQLDLLRIGSQNLKSKQRLQVAQTLHEALDARRGKKRKKLRYDAIMISMGSDALAENAFFWSLLHPANRKLRDAQPSSEVPVVITGAMHEADHPETDGPQNLFDALIVACERASRGRGVLVVEHGQIHYSQDVVKLGTDPGAFFSRNGRAGTVIDGRVDYERETPLLDLPEIQLSLDRSLPKVALHLVHSEIDKLTQWRQITKGRIPQGLVLAAMGAGNLPDQVLKHLHKLQPKDWPPIPIVVSSDQPFGRVPATGGEIVFADHYGVIPALNLVPPKKAQMALQFALAADPGAGGIALFETIATAVR